VILGGEGVEDLTVELVERDEVVRVDDFPQDFGLSTALRPVEERVAA